MTYPIRNETTVRESIRQELPDVVREDREIRNLVVEVDQKRFADRDRTEGRIDRILDELRRDREQNDRRWEKSIRKWEEQRAADRLEWEEHIQENKRLSETVLPDSNAPLGPWARIGGPIPNVPFGTPWRRFWKRASG